MKAFFARYSFLFIWILALIIFGAISVLVFQLSAFTGSFAPAILPPSLPAAPAGPAVPQAPSATLTIEKSATGDTLRIQWENLPDGTTALEIFRAKTGTQDWSLWNTIDLSPAELSDGQNEMHITADDAAGYSFYLQAVNENGGDGTSGNGTGTPGEEVLWTSSSTVPGVATTTQSTQGNSSGSSPATQNGGNPPANQNGTSTNNSSTASTPPQNTAGSPTSPSGTGNGPTPSGDPYYNPQVQIEAYGSGQSGNFWVQHMDQEIQMGWQNLPSSTTNIVIYRSNAETGPWTQVFAQGNPDVSQPYSIQVVDDTLGAPYYYELVALEGSTTLATYGPAYLAPPGKS